jgi:hypothetical protein
VSLLVVKRRQQTVDLCSLIVRPQSETPLGCGAALGLAVAAAGWRRLRLAAWAMTEQRPGADIRLQRHRAVQPLPLLLAAHLDFLGARAALDGARNAWVLDGARASGAV